MELNHFKYHKFLHNFNDTHNQQNTDYCLLSCPIFCHIHDQLFIDLGNESCSVSTNNFILQCSINNGHRKVPQTFNLKSSIAFSSSIFVYIFLYLPDVSYVNVQMGFYFLLIIVVEAVSPVIAGLGGFLLCVLVDYKCFLAI